MREDIIKMEFEDMAFAIVVWTEIKLAKHNLIEASISREYA
jgi:hypothetical protein